MRVARNEVAALACFLQTVGERGGTISVKVGENSSCGLRSKDFLDAAHALRVLSNRVWGGKKRRRVKPSPPA